MLSSITDVEDVCSGGEGGHSIKAMAWVRLIREVLVAEVLASTVAGRKCNISVDAEGDGSDRSDVDMRISTLECLQERF
jgi:hypothetical protein